MGDFVNTAKDATSNVVSGTSELVGSTLNDFTVAINNFLIKVTSNQWLSTFIILFFVVYGSALGSRATNLPPVLVKLFKNPVIKVILLTVIAFEINKDLTMSVVLALAFYLTQQYIFHQESFEQIKTLENLQSRYYLNKEKATKAN